MTASVPVWVFAVLFALLLLGYRQSLTRVVRPSTVATVALAMLVFSLYGVTAAFGAVALPLLAWAVGYTASVLVGSEVFAPRGLAREGTSVRVPGSWLPMGLLLGIFAAKFTLGFARGIGSPIVHESWFIGTASAALGVLSGGFAARAIALHRFAKSASAA